MAAENTADLGAKFWGKAEELLFSGLSRAVDAELTDRYGPAPQRVTTASAETGQVFEAGKPVNAPETQIVAAPVFKLSPITIAAAVAVGALLWYLASND